MAEYFASDMIRKRNITDRIAEDRVRPTAAHCRAEV